jgi:hypothetical protein
MLTQGQIVKYHDKDKRAHFARVVEVGRVWVTLSHGLTEPRIKVRMDEVTPWPPLRTTDTVPTRRVKRGAA